MKKTEKTFEHFNIACASDARLSALFIGNDSPGNMGGGTAN